MKLLLTSGGLTNEILRNEFLSLVKKPAADISVAFITTAAKVEKNTSYMDEDINDLKIIGVNIVNKIDISDPRGIWEDVLRNSGVIWIEGGNTFYLLDELRKSGLDKTLINYLESKVFVGVSAGSIVVTPTIAIAQVEPADKNEVGITDLSSLDWVDFEISPHTSDVVPLVNLEKYVKGIKNKLYAIDDNSAVLLNDNDVKVIGGGFSKIFN